MSDDTNSAMEPLQKAAEVAVRDRAASHLFAWPPRFAIDADHWWGRTFDPLQLARPVWWKMTIWIDVLLFGPFYVVATYAYLRGRAWIRIPSIIYAAVMLTTVTIILGEEAAGPHRSPYLPVVLLANAAWVLVPLYILYRMVPHADPFAQREALPVRSRATPPPAGIT